jgi:hypothetical protein
MMKKHRKYRFLTVLSLCLIILFAACGQHPTMNVDQYGLAYVLEKLPGNGAIQHSFQFFVS